MFGVALGLLVTLTSVGAGAIGVSVLAALYPLLPAKRIVGSDVAHAVPLTLVGGLGHLGLGHVDGSLLLALLSGSIPGILLGARLAGLAPEWLLAAHSRRSCSATRPTCCSINSRHHSLAASSCGAWRDSENMSHTAINIAAITGPATKPFSPNIAMPPSVEISTM